MSVVRSYGRPIWDVRRAFVYIFLLAFALYIVTPFMMIVVTSFGKGWFGRQWLPSQWTMEWYQWGMRVGNIPGVLKNSLVIAGITILISLLVGIPTGWALGRRRIPGRGLLVAVLLLPRMIPTIAYALGVAQIFYSVRLIDTYLGVALAHVAISAPYAVLIMMAAFEGLDERVLEAANVCGAGPVRRFFGVILPMVLPGILASVMFTFVTSYNEFTLTIMTYGPHTMTLPVKTYLVIGDGYWEVASAISLVMLVPSLLILVLVQQKLRPDQLVGGFKGT